MRVLFCNCTHAKVVPPLVKREVLRRLSTSGIAFDAVADLCELSARKDPTLRTIASADDLRIAACFPRAVTWLFDAADAPLSAQHVEVLNMRRQSAEEVVSRLLSEKMPGPEQPS
jgi:heterodisulfide reductase subunit A-like polyferredoxin